MTDRWTLTLAGLLGEPWPMPPDLPGLVHVCRDDVIGEAEREEILASTMPDAEAALLLQVSRARVGQLRAALAGNA